ncbi:hypothetical protein HRQ87_19255 [Sulfitobacter sp. 1151]|uniref:Novel toxin 16 domain-containing protein n=2 Tax=Parasulfitobacter algicola TaxID=2614809 RepID=A0ABX2IVH8_9RHOB|nr:hypothetical protein [Sulfitobacter algicola]
MIYYRARHYDPSIGMFVQSDPIGFAAGQLSIYSFVANNPTKWTDPTGLMASMEERAMFAKDSAQGVGSSTRTGVAALNVAGYINALLAKIPLNSGRYNTPGAGYNRGRPGDCTLLELNTLTMLRDSIPKRACRPPARIADPNDRFVTRGINLAKMRGFSRRALLQAQINAQCFRGGDAGHRAAVAREIAAMDNCNLYIQKF